MRFEALGPLSVASNGGLVNLRPAHRRLLACLLLHANGWVGFDTLVDRMWGESPPATPRNTLQAHVSAVRRLVPEVIRTSSAGYQLDLTAHEFDVPEFSDLATEASRRLKRGHAREAGELAARARDLWRGDPYPELEDVDAARGERARLTELSISVHATISMALVMQGHMSESIAYLEKVVVEHPWHEPLWEELVRAYYLAGRQADALRALGQIRGALRDHLGVEPGSRLRRLEEGVLVHDPDLIGREVVANNLPALDSSFVGREPDVAAVLDLLGKHHLVSIVGGPGIGKTRLALEAASQAMSGFPGGVWLVRLDGARTDRDVAATIATTTEITDSIESLEKLYERLASQPALLILDNCEHVLTAVQQFVGAPNRGSVLRVLATSRTRLGGPEEVVWRLRELPTPRSREDMWASPALQLFADRVRAADPTVWLHAADPDEVIEACRRTGGVPLVLELAARRAPSFGLDRLAGLTLDPAPATARSDPERHDSVGNAIDWSLAPMRARDQVAFIASSVFAGSFTVEGFGHVCLPHAPSDEATVSLDLLVESSLLTTERPGGLGVRYRLLQPIREYGLDRLTSEETKQVLDRHADFFVKFARAAKDAAGSPAEAVMLRQVDESIADHRSAMRHLLEMRRPQEAVEIAAGLSQYWIARYLGWEGARWLSDCLEFDMDDDHRVGALAAAGGVAFFVGRYDQSEALYSQVLELALAKGDRLHEAQALYGLGRVAVHRRPAEGRILLQRGVDAFRGIGDEVMAAECLLVIGIQEAYAADCSAADVTLTTAMRALEESPKLAAVGHRYLSLVAWHLDDEEAARHHLESAERMARQSDDRRVFSGTLTQRAMVEGKWGLPSRAATAIIEALKPITDQHGIYFCLSAFGAMPVLVAREEWTMASRLFSHFDRVYEESGWIPLDERMAAAPGYRAQVTAGLATSGQEPDHNPVATSVLAQDLTETLERIAQSASLRSVNRQPRIRNGTDS